MSGKLRVLHMIQNLHYGGMERLIAEIVRLTDGTRFESHVLGLQYLGRFAEGLEGQAGLHVGRPLPPYSMIWPGPLIEQIREIAPDVVHIHSGVWYKASLAARRAGVPRVIYTEHGRTFPTPGLVRFTEGRAARRTDVVVAVSGPLAERMETEIVRGRCPIVTVTNGVDTGTFVPASDNGLIRNSLGIPDGVPILGSVGRLEPVKGYDQMMEAFADLLATGDEDIRPHLILVGDGTERVGLEEQASSLGLAENVHCLGWRDDLHDLHSAFDLFTMSSRSEGTSVSLLEAMSAGLPVRVTDVGGNRAVLGDSLAHCLVPAGDPSALSESWRALLKDPERSKSDGISSRERVVKSYSIETMVRSYEELYAG